MFVIGLDIGTTGTKALLVDETGKICGSGYQGYPLMSSGSHVEQDPEDWWRACRAAVRQACADGKAPLVAALSVSAQGASLAALSESLRPVGSAITWLDTRAGEEAAYLGERLGEEYVYETTGWKLSPSLDAAKILYMKRHGLCPHAGMFVSTLEYVNLKLTGRIVTDPTCAGIRQLYDVEKGRWDPAILEAVGCGERELPQVLPTGAFLGTLLPEAASALGLGTNVRVYNGAHDQYCASIGSGAVREGDLLLSTGTAWAAMGISSRPLRSESRIASCTHPVAGLYGNMVSLAGAGVAYQWVRDRFFPGMDLSELDALCAGQAGKAGELVFLPWLSGCLYPYYHSSAKGGFLGAGLSSTSADFALSVMESAAFAVKAAMEDFACHGYSARALRVMGGAAKSPLWMSILGCVLETEIQRLKTADVCPLGAAAVALTAQGCFNSLACAAESLSDCEPLPPCPGDLGYYRDKYRLYRRVTEHMSSFYSEPAVPAVPGKSSSDEGGSI